jgi:GNAT superfamily N-acetyltransferase
MAQFSLATIRKAVSTDATGILECLRLAFEPYRTSYPPEAFLDTVVTPDVLQQRLATMSAFVAVSDPGEVVGTIAGHVIHPETNSDEPSSADSGKNSKANLNEGHIRGMAVLPAWQGSGVADRLLKSVESELLAGGCSSISLDTTEPLVKAIRFYERNGFRASGRVTYFCGMRRLEFVKTLTE